MDGRAFAPYPSDEYHRMAIFNRQPVEVGDALPFADRGVTVVAQGTALLAVAAKSAQRPVNVNALVEKIWQTRATTRWWSVVEGFRREALTDL